MFNLLLVVIVIIVIVGAAIVVVIIIIIVVVVDQAGVVVTTATFAPLDGCLVIIAIGVVAIAFGQRRVLCKGPLGKRHFPDGYSVFPALWLR